MTLLEDRPTTTPEEQPRFVEELTDGECALLAILMDRSGVDLAEFLLIEESEADKCFRAQPFQFAWWRKNMERSIEQSARDIGKSLGIELKSYAFPFNFPGEEHVVIAPEGAHLDSLTQRIEGRIRGNWFLNSMVKGGTHGITHRPFTCIWRNGTKTYTRLPQRSGLGVKGIHAMALDIDEGQDLPQAAWDEVPATVKEDVPGHRWTVHGVSKGIRDEFWRISQPNSGWPVIQITKFSRSDYSDPERYAQLIKDWAGNGGTEDSPNFVRNVIGDHGNAADRIFVLQNLMNCRDTRDADHSKYNREVYYFKTISGEQIAAAVGSEQAVEVSSEQATKALLELVQFPANHKEYNVTWVGMDVGIVSDPTEIIVAAEHIPDKRERADNIAGEIGLPDEGQTRLKVLTRIQLMHMTAPLQADLIMHLIDFYRPKAFSMDAGGNGYPVFQELQKRSGLSRIMAVEPPDDADEEATTAFNEHMAKAKSSLTVIKGYKFGAKIIIDFDETKVAELTDPDMKEMIDKAGLFAETKVRSTDVLREDLVNARRLLLPDDEEILSQMQAQTQAPAKDAVDAYTGKPKMVYGGVGPFHILDALRFMALGWSQHQIEKITKVVEKKKRPVIDSFMSF